jgi:hypothetical protein
MGAVAPLQQATGLRSLTFEHLADSCSLVYLPLLTQLTELSISPWRDEDVGLAVGNPPRTPLADMTHLRSLCLDQSDNLYKFKLCEDDSVDQTTLPLVLPPNLTELEVAVPSCWPGTFWRQIAGCSQLVSLTVIMVFNDDVDAAADHPSWMLHHLAGCLPHLQHLSMHGFGKPDTPHLPVVLGVLAFTVAGQQQEEEHGWDWADLAAPGLGETAADNIVVVPPPNMGALTALQTVEFGDGYQFRCCGPHHWHALAGCSALQELHWVEAWQVPPAGVKFPGVTDLKLLVAPPGDTVSVLGAFPTLQTLRLELDLDRPLMQEVSYDC